MCLVLEADFGIIDIAGTMASKDEIILTNMCGTITTLTSPRKPNEFPVLSQIAGCG